MRRGDFEGGLKWRAKEENECSSHAHAEVLNSRGWTSSRLLLYRLELK